MAMDTSEPPNKASLLAQDVYRFHPEKLAEWLRRKLKEGNGNGQK
jgi:hypothetical protein